MEFFYATIFSSISTLFIDNFIPAFHLVLQSIGLFIVVIVWIRFPKMANVLPFEAIRLDVIEYFWGLRIVPHTFGRTTIRIWIVRYTPG